VAALGEVDEAPKTIEEEAEKIATYLDNTFKFKFLLILPTLRVLLLQDGETPKREVLSEAATLKEGYDVDLEAKRIIFNFEKHHQVKTLRFSL